MSGGAGAALDQVMAEAGDDLDAAQLVQAALFDDLAEAETGALDAPSPLSAAIQPKRKGPGRPPGARNKRTEAVAAWLLSQHRHPVAVMLEAASMRTDDFLTAAGFSRDDKDALGGPAFSNPLRMEALKLQYRLAEAAAPYVAQKLPQAVQLNADAGLTVKFEGVSFPARGVGPGEPAAVIEGEIMGVRLPKSDDASRTDDEDPELLEEMP